MAGLPHAPPAESDRAGSIKQGRFSAIAQKPTVSENARGLGSRILTPDCRTPYKREAAIT